MPGTTRLGREAVGKLPWVRTLRRGNFLCEAVARGSRRMCSHVARWSFTPLPSSTARAGRYCLVHLNREGLFADDVEARRTTRWIDKHPEEFPVQHPPEPEDVKLDLSQEEDLAVFVSLVPNWPDLAEGLDLKTPEGTSTFVKRLQSALDDAVGGIVADVRALNQLPPPD